jgi:uncharacterized protein with HEPN domain
MTPAKRQFDIYMEDILKSMLRITEYIEGQDFTDFKKNYMVVDAVVRNFEIIGEASKNIPIKWYEPQSKLWTQRKVQAPRN